MWLCAFSCMFKKRKEFFLCLVTFTYNMSWSRCFLVMSIWSLIDLVYIDIYLSQDRGNFLLLFNWMVFLCHSLHSFIFSFSFHLTGIFQKTCLQVQIFFLLFDLVGILTCSFSWLIKLSISKVFVWLFFKISVFTVVVVHTHNPSNWEIEPERSWVWG
jgi:hypothetical protein